MVDPDQTFEPRSASRQLPDGRIVSPPLEDMYPFLSREEMERRVPHLGLAFGDTAMTGNPLAADLDSVLDQTRTMWEDVRGQRIFITGGTGFFGCWLLESFLWANSRLRLQITVTVLTRDRLAFERKCPWITDNPSVQLVDGDVTSFSPAFRRVQSRDPRGDRGQRAHDRRSAAAYDGHHRSRDQAGSGFCRHAPDPAALADELRRRLRSRPTRLPLAHSQTVPGGAVRPTRSRRTAKGNGPLNSSAPSMPDRITSPPPSPDASHSSDLHAARHPLCGRKLHSRCHAWRIHSRRG